MQRFTSLRVKLVFVFVGLMFIAIAGMALYGYLFTRTALYGQAAERSGHQVHLQAESMVSSLKQVGGDALYLSVLRSLQRLRELRRESAAEDQIALWESEVAQDFLMFSSVRPMYSELSYIDAQGRRLVSVESDGRKVRVASTRADLAQDRYFQKTMALQSGGAYVSAFAQDQDAAADVRPFIHYALKLPDDDGIVLIDFHAGWLLRDLPATTGPETWVILDQDGNYLVYPEGFHPEDKRLDVRPMLGGNRGQLETAEGVFVFDTIHPSAATPERFWVISSETPTLYFYADVTTFYALTSAVIISALLFALALSLVASDRILKPVLELERQMASYGHNGRVPRLPERNSGDEIGVLTRTFCEMAEELERKKAQERHLVEQIISAQEEERKLVAYDLHDGLIQQLVGARYYLTPCVERCGLAHHDASASVKLGYDALTDAIVEGRRIVEGLHPATLDDLGLAAAVEEAAQGTARRAGWKLILDVEPIASEPEKVVSVTIFRIAQEALNNIWKHASAQEVHVTMRNGNGIELMIEDDGVGFEPGPISGDGRGLGITTMRERAALIHGLCEIKSTRGSGTRVRVRVPLTAQSVNPAHNTVATLPPN